MGSVCSPYHSCRQGRFLLLIGEISNTYRHNTIERCATWRPNPSSNSSATLRPSCNSPGLATRRHLQTGIRMLIRFAFTRPYALPRLMLIKRPFKYLTHYWLSNRSRVTSLTAIIIHRRESSFWHRCMGVGWRPVSSSKTTRPLRKTTPRSLSFARIYPLKKFASTWQRGRLWRRKLDWTESLRRCDEEMGNKWQLIMTF